MALAQNLENDPGRQPKLTGDENRIAEAVVAALEPRFVAVEERMGKQFAAFEERMDKQFVAFEERMDKRFVDHMTEIETYYAARDKQRDQNMTAIKQDFETILSILESNSQ